MRFKSGSVFNVLAVGHGAVLPICGRAGGMAVMALDFVAHALHTADSRRELLTQLLLRVSQNLAKD